MNKSYLQQEENILKERYNLNKSTLENVYF